MASFTIRDVSETAAQALKERAAAAGMPVEAFIRDWIERQAQEPVVRQSYGIRAVGPDDAHATVKRHRDGISGRGAANLSQRQMGAYREAILLVERNQPGDRERAIGLLRPEFADVFEVAG